MSYQAPGQLADFTPALLDRWNEQILEQYDRLDDDFGSRFFTIDPSQVQSPTPTTVTWPGSPAEPDFCLGPIVARQLSDWGVRGRQELHNEYCEYLVVTKIDAQGKVRPKRVIVSTELREYWACAATYDPQVLLTMATEVLGFQPTWQDLYGLDDPNVISEQERLSRFNALVAGGGGGNGPSQPHGRLNTENIMFMSHPINGLDDLLYIVMFGAKPYSAAVPTGNGQPPPANKEQIFRAFGVEHLACRHADPAACMAAYGTAFAGRLVAFADPLGMYIQTFSDNVFTYQSNPVPAEWVRLSRGTGPGLYQRLEFGPGDDVDVFLDDLMVDGEAVTGGYQVVERVEVGPNLVFGPESPVADNEYVPLATSADDISCGEAGVCNQIRALKRDYDNQHAVVVRTPRTLVRPNG